jgi:hypothetical protein
LPAQGAHEHLAASGENIRERHSGITQHQLAHLIRVRGATGLDDRQTAIPFTGLHEIVQMDPRIGNG